MQNCALVQLTEVNELARSPGGAGAGDQLVPSHEAAAGVSLRDAAVKQYVAVGQERPVVAME
jgi:hypothetical protein